MKNLSLDEALEQLVHEMEAHAIPEKGVSMAAYLKDHFKCYGIKSPIRNEIQRKWFSYIKPHEFNTWDVVYNLWNLDEREFQYIALDLLKKQRKSFFKQDDHMKLEELITTKSWWDSVDGLASNQVGTYFEQYPDQIDPIITKWRNSDNMWLNRTCLIFQLKYKDNVDFELLKGLIRQYQPVKEFFIQKAIGWSLRQYSKFNPEAVKDFVEEIDLQGLARREAVKYI
jgi:3-methyladenine DNA glycosylase AlkD